jgi:nucleoside-diphosphate-sugar epimerase
MSTYLVVGAGAIGSVVSTQLADQGHAVRLLSRGGAGPDHPLVERIRGDASDADVVSKLGAGTEAIFNCANPQYHRWPTDWPPIANALLHAAEIQSSALVTLGNLYAYGPPAGPMSPHDPLAATYEKARVRATMWFDALRANDEGRVRATEVRSSDFIGPMAQGYLGERVVPKLLAGKTCRVLGSATTVHSWNYTVDVARTLVACAQSDVAWGRAWHAPANPARTATEAIDDMADVAGVRHVKVGVVPSIVVKALGVVSPLMRELPTTMYQFTAPFVIDDLETRATFGLEPTAWHEVLEDTIRSFRTG